MHPLQPNQVSVAGSVEGDDLDDYQRIAAAIAFCGRTEPSSPTWPPWRSISTSVNPMSSDSLPDAAHGDRRILRWSLTVRSVLDFGLTILDFGLAILN